MADPTTPTTDTSSSDTPGFAAGPPVASLCGFTLPLPVLKNFGFKIPGPGFPIPPPIPKPGLGLACNTHNPLNVSSGFPPGGGRVPNVPPDPDDTAVKQDQSALTTGTP